MPGKLFDTELPPDLSKQWCENLSDIDGGVDAAAKEDWSHHPPASNCSITMELAGWSAEASESRTLFALQQPEAVIMSVRDVIETDDGGVAETNALPLSFAPVDVIGAPPLSLLVVEVGDCSSAPSHSENEMVSAADPSGGCVGESSFFLFVEYPDGLRETVAFAAAAVFEFCSAVRVSAQQSDKS